MLPLRGEPMLLPRRRKPQVAHQNLPLIPVILKESVHKRGERAEWRRIKITMKAERHTLFWEAMETGNQSSAWITSLTQADALLPLPEGPFTAQAGEMMEAHLLPWMDQRSLFRRMPSFVSDSV